MVKVNKVYNKDFLELVKTIPDNSVDLYIHDLPYEINYNNKKNYNDAKGFIDYELLSNECYRTLANDGNLVIFAGWSNVTNILIKLLQCTTKLTPVELLYLMKNETVGNLFKLFSTWQIQDWIIWDRIKGRGAKNKLISTREDIVVLSKNNDIRSTFNVMESNTPKATKGFGSKNGKNNRILSNVWSDIPPLMFTTQEYKDSVGSDGKGYKGQKPVALIKRLIDVYSNEGDLVVDEYCGSGSTACAAIDSNRDFICNDISKEAVDITKRRVLGKSK